MSSSRRRKREGNGNSFTRKAKTLPEISVRLHFMCPRLERFSWPPLTVRESQRKDISVGHFGTIFSITSKIQSPTWLGRPWEFRFHDWPPNTSQIHTQDQCWAFRHITALNPQRNSIQAGSINSHFINNNTNTYTQNSVPCKTLG